MNASEEGTAVAYRNVSFATSESYQNGVEVAREAQQDWAPKLVMKLKGLPGQPGEDQEETAAADAGGGRS